MINWKWLKCTLSQDFHYIPLKNTAEFLTNTFSKQWTLSESLLKSFFNLMFHLTGLSFVWRVFLQSSSVCPCTLSLHTKLQSWRSGKDCISLVHFCVCLLPPQSLVKQKASLLPNSVSPGVWPQLQRQGDYGSELIPLLICTHSSPTSSICSHTPSLVSWFNAGFI